MTVQVRWRRRFGFERLPVVTGVTFAVTATTSVLGLVVPGMLEAWERTPQGLHGQWWRTCTALLVQDGGVVGTLSNLAFLLVVGALAEQVLRRWRWLACYLGAGVAAEFAGYAWQPRGAGNSGAVCGLAGALIVLLVTGAELSWLAPVALLYWCGALLAARWGVVPLVVVVVVGMLGQGMLARGAPGSRLPFAVGRVVAVAAAVVALVLVAARDIHGAALVAGVVLAAVTGPEVVHARHRR